MVAIALALFCLARPPGTAAAVPAATGCHGPGADRYQSLVELVIHGERGGPVQRIEGLVPLLPEELLRNFTLVYQSRGPDGAASPSGKRQIDARHPRVILFSEDARLVLSFTGDPAGPAYDIVEAIHFCDEERRFELSRFVLPAAKRRGAWLVRVARDNGSPDPPECQRCHGADPRPMFDAYPLWPGFYGSVQDHLGPRSRELRDYQAFLLGVRQAKRGVYRFLRFRRDTPVPPYYIDDGEGLTDSDDLVHTPNTRLGMALTELNRQRIFRQVAASPVYIARRSSVPYKILSGLLGCEQVPVGPDDVERMRVALVAENQGRLRRQGFAEGSRGARELEMQEFGSEQNLAEVDWVARALRVDRTEWAMAFEPGSLALYDGVLSGDLGERNFYLKEDLTLELYADLAREDPALGRTFSTYQAFRGHAFGKRLYLDLAVRGCPLLLAKTQGMEWPAAAPARPDPGRWALTRCLPCHDEDDRGDGAPPIPFSQPALLGRSARSSGHSLRDEIFDRIRPGAARPMPSSGPPLTDEEIKALSRYISAPVPRTGEVPKTPR